MATSRWDEPEITELIDTPPDQHQTKERIPKSPSPDQCCSICLGKYKDKAFTDTCFHTFCFVCLKEWANVRQECPLCKTKFKSIIHNVLSNEVYDQFHLPTVHLQNAHLIGEERSFRYATTLTEERRLLHDWRRDRMFNREVSRAERARRQAAAEDRRRLIYAAGLRVLHMGSNSHSRFRDISPEFFTANPAVTHRLVPWMRRELGVLFNNHDEHVTFLTHYILSLITNIDIQSEGFHTTLRPFLYGRTEHFIHELASFARSPYDMEAYDEHAQYDFRGGIQGPPLRRDQPLITVPESVSDGNASDSENSVEILPINNELEVIESDHEIEAVPLNREAEVVQSDRESEVVQSDHESDIQSDHESEVMDLCSSDSSDHEIIQEGPPLHRVEDSPPTQNPEPPPEPPPEEQPCLPGPSGYMTNPPPIIVNGVKIKQEPWSDIEYDSDDSSVQYVGFIKSYFLRTPEYTMDISSGIESEPSPERHRDKKMSKHKSKNRSRSNSRHRRSRSHSRHWRLRASRSSSSEHSSRRSKHKRSQRGKSRSRSRDHRERNHDRYSRRRSRSRSTSRRSSSKSRPISFTRAGSIPKRPKRSRHRSPSRSRSPSSTRDLVLLLKKNSKKSTASAALRNLLGRKSKSKSRSKSTERTKSKERSRSRSKSKGKTASTKHSSLSAPTLGSLLLAKSKTAQKHPKTPSERETDLPNSSAKGSSDHKSGSHSKTSDNRPTSYSEKSPHSASRHHTSEDKERTRGSSREKERTQKRSSEVSRKEKEEHSRSHWSESHSSSKYDEEKSSSRKLSTNKSHSDKYRDKSPPDRYTQSKHKSSSKTRSSDSRERSDKDHSSKHSSSGKDRDMSSSSKSSKSHSKKKR